MSLIAKHQPLTHNDVLRAAGQIANINEAVSELTRLMLEVLEQNKELREKVEALENIAKTTSPVVKSDSGIDTQSQAPMFLIEPAPPRKTKSQKPK